MKINAQAPVKTLAGENYKSGDKDISVGSVIADILAQDQTGGKMKLYSLAKRFFDDKEVEIDEADAALVKKAVEESKSYNNIIIGQILLLLK